jgi:hypothetical protein
MKEILKHLHQKGALCFNFWSYIYLYSNEKNEFEYTVEKLQKIFSIKSRSTIYLYLNMQNEWNVEGKIFTEIETIVEPSKNKKGIYKLKFYNNAKKQKPVKEKPISIVIEECQKFILDFYKQINFTYLKIDTKHIVSIQNKIDLLLIKNGSVLTDELKIESFKVIFQKMPKWWADNNHFSLSTVNKNFDKIVNDIKSKENGKFSNKAIGTAKESIDFSKYTE